MATLDMELWETKMWANLDHALFVEFPNLPGSIMQEMIDWLFDPSRPGQFAHYPARAFAWDTGRTIFVMSDPRVCFEFKMRWA
ncbi:MAG: hypothetical protein EOP83_31085 [Verrucomicrobiaceae bacterium]|nr:MAG: hypothetical protein EOP83_31085 [Verrucomicrobiaceae bacterium]